MRDDHALSEVIGTILTVSVVLTGASAIMLWGGPYMEELESKAVGEEAHNKLSQAIENIEDITHETAGSRRTFQMDVKRGLFDIENVGDRFVFSYSMIDGYDFTVAGLDDNNKTFSIDFFILLKLFDIKSLSLSL